MGYHAGGCSRVLETAGPREQTGRLNSSLCWSDGASEAELCYLAGEAVGLCFGRGAIEVIWAEVLIERAVAEHVVDVVKIDAAMAQTAFFCEKASARARWGAAWDGATLR